MCNCEFPVETSISCIVPAAEATTEKYSVPETRHATTLGPDFQKILGKILSLALVFPKFMLSLSKVMKLRFSQNFKFNSLLQY